MEEKQFVSEIVSGNKEAVEKFVADNRKRVFHTCLGYVQNTSDAEDLTQEVFIKAFEKMSKFRGDSKLSSWILRIAINLAKNYVRDNKKRLNQFPIEDIALLSEDKPYGFNRQIGTAIRKAVYALPSKQKEVFILSSYLGFSYKEIAQITKYSIASIESLLFRARRNLRKQLQGFYEMYHW
jgi:RNA polymerase sigma-70 factor (ECF subfamily)